MANIFDGLLIFFTLLFTSIVLIAFITSKVGNKSVINKDGRLYKLSREYYWLIGLILIIRSFIYEPYKIPSGSMYPTFEVHDFILVEKFSYFMKVPILNKIFLDIAEPERGDIVVFNYPKDPSVRYVKRLIGLPGDKITYINDTLFINGKEVEKNIVGEFTSNGGKDYIGKTNIYSEKMNDEISYFVLNDKSEYSTAVVNVEVPEGKYFFMGDNRNHSADGRFWGFVEKKDLVGKAKAIWISFSDGFNYKRIGAINYNVLRNDK